MELNKTMRGSLKSKRASGEEMPRVSARLQLEQASKMNVSQHLEPESLTNPSSLETLLAEEEEQDASELLSPSSCSFVLSSVADSPLPPPTRKVTALTESQHDYALRQPPQQRVVDGDTQDNQENEEPVRRLPRRILPQRVSAGELVVSYATEEELWSALRSSNSVVEEELPVEAEDESSLATTALLTPSRLRSSKTHQTEEEEQETTPVRAERRSSRRALAAQQQATHLGQVDSDEESNEVLQQMVQITSDHTICILDDDVLLGRRGCRKLRVHLLADNVIHSPFSTKTDIGTKGEVEIVVPHCHIMSQDFLDALVPTKESPPESGETVDISDDAYLPSHKRRELQEKKSKNRAKEIYRHEMYLLSLHQENESRKKDWSLTSLLGQSAPSTPTSAVETLSVSTTTAVTPAAISPYPNTPGGSESLRIGVFRGTELVSIDPEEWISIMAEKNIQSHFVAPPSIREVPEEPSEDDEELVNDETSISSAKERRPPKRARRSKTNSIE